MAGTPTQYLGLPTYADSDAVDLTAQYNQSMSIIDSAIHALETGNAEIPGIAVLGDSWTDASTAADDWVRRMGGLLGLPTYNYAVSGAAIAKNFSAQVARMLADKHRICGVVIVGGVNDLQGDEVTTSYEMVQAVNALAILIRSAYPTAKIMWFINAPSMDPAFDGVEGVRIAWNKAKNGALFIPAHPRLMVEGDPFLPLAVASIAGYSDDYIHPSSNGSQQIAQYVAARMTGQLPNVCFEGSATVCGIWATSTGLAVKSPTTVNVVDSANKNVSVINAYVANLAATANGSIIGHTAVGADISAFERQFVTINLDWTFTLNGESS